MIELKFTGEFDELDPSLSEDILASIKLNESAIACLFTPNKDGEYEWCVERWERDAKPDWLYYHQVEALFFSFLKKIERRDLNA